MSQKHVDILLEARWLIERGSSCYVCLAIKEASGDYTNPPDAALEILRGIHEDLGEGHLHATTAGISLNGWIERYEEISLSDKDIRLCRLAWLDALIEYWRDK
jgi:hypothetical protein